MKMLLSSLALITSVALIAHEPMQDQKQRPSQQDLNQIKAIFERLKLTVPLQEAQAREEKYVTFIKVFTPLYVAGKLTSEEVKTFNDVKSALIKGVRQVHDNPNVLLTLNGLILQDILKEAEKEMTSPEKLKQLFDKK